MQKKQKLLQILYPGIGGHSSVAFSLIEGDKESEFNHSLLGYGVEDPSQNFVDKIFDTGAELNSAKIKSGFKLKTYKLVYKKIKKINPDYIIMHSTSLIWVVWLYAKFNSKSFISVEHQSNQAKTLKDWFYTSLILILSPKIVYLTQAYCEQISKKYKLFYPSSKIRVIQNGINTLIFNPKSKNLSNNTINITMISRMTKLRDHKTLIDAFCNISDRYPVYLYIAGGGETYEEFQKYITQVDVNENIQLLGTITETEIVKLLSETHIYVHSSLAETLSTSILQAMACEIPIIATNISGIKNLLKHQKDSLFFDTGDVEMLEQNIQQIIENKSLRDTLAKEANHKFNNNYTSKVMFKKYNLLIQKEI